MKPRGRSIFSRRPAPEQLARRHGWRVLGVWLPAVVMVLVITVESTGTFSAEHTSGFLRPLIERFFGHTSDTAWYYIHRVFRKSGHFIGYGLVGLSFLRAWLWTFADRGSWSDGAWRLRASIVAVVCTFLVAGGDEWHQTYLPSRTGQFSDVMLDTAGATTMCLLAWLLLGRRRSQG